MCGLSGLPPSQGRPIVCAVIYHPSYFLYAKLLNDAIFLLKNNYTIPCIKIISDLHCHYLCMVNTRHLNIPNTNRENNDGWLLNIPPWEYHFYVVGILCCNLQGQPSVTCETSFLTKGCETVFYPLGISPVSLLHHRTSFLLVWIFLLWNQG